MAVAPARARRNLASRRRLAVVTVVVLGAFGFLVSRGLGDAALYFRTADEAVAQKDRLGDRRFRLEGVVLAGVRSDPSGEGVDFAVEENGVRVDVRHQGDPPELFKADIPVVLEGRWDGDRFASDRIMVKHSEQYRVENPDRVEGSPTS